jgi:ABC-type bacteriocin/lantibiotic exporter with double-glycine peptidase domain
LNELQNKTRLLVTHAVDFLHLVDEIIVMKQGEIVLKGSFEEIKNEPYLVEIINIHKSHEK